MELLKNNEEVSQIENILVEKDSIKEILLNDFEMVKEKIESISDVFDSEQEFQRIKNLSKTERKIQFDDFKQKLNRQELAMVKLYVFLKKIIEKDIDNEKEYLKYFLDLFSNNYGFSDDIKNNIEDVLNDYLCNKENIKTIRDFYKNDIDLIIFLSEKDIDKNEEVKIKINPLSIDIYCKNHLARVLAHCNEDEDVFFACALSSKDGIMYNVINIDTINNQSDKESFSAHENQHQENAFLKRFFCLKDDKRYEFWQSYQNETNIDMKKIFLKNYMQSEREIALEKVKDEIFATKKDGDKYSYDFFFEENSVYDYLASVKNYEDENETFDNTILYKNFAKEILVVEYERIVRKALKTFDDLLNEGKLSIEEIVILLTDKPLAEWLIVSKRYLKH